MMIRDDADDDINYMEKTNVIIRNMLREYTHLSSLCIRNPAVSKALRTENPSTSPVLLISNERKEYWRAERDRRRSAGFIFSSCTRIMSTKSNSLEKFHIQVPYKNVEERRCEFMLEEDLEIRAYLPQNPGSHTLFVLSSTKTLVFMLTILLEQ